MSEPTEPDSAPDSAPDSEPATEPATEPEAEPDAVAEDAQLLEQAPPPETGSTPNNRQLVYILATLVAAAALAGGIFGVAKLVGDDSEPISAEKQAEKTVSDLLRGYDKVANKDESGCKLIADNVILPPEEAGFLDECIEETSKAGEDTPLQVTDIKATKITLDRTAGTGTVVVDVVTVGDGTTPQTNSATVPVRKVDGRWKVDPDAVQQ